MFKKQLSDSLNVDINMKSQTLTEKKLKLSRKLKMGKNSETEDESRDDSGYDTDLRNIEVIFFEHSDNATEALRLQRYDDSPMAKKEGEVVIKIETSTVSIDDCRIRDGSYKWSFGEKPRLPLCPGMDCFGTVLSCGSDARKFGLTPGDKVGALALHGCNAKYTTMSYTNVIKAPEELDPCSAVCVIRTYTAAFQALMWGKVGHTRYSRKPLSGKKVLIVGCCGTFGRALVELSLFLGSKRVYFASTQPQDNYIRLLGAKPLDGNPDEWLEAVEGKIDIAIDSVCEDRYEHSYAALNDDGILVGTGMEEITRYGEDIISDIEKVWTHATVTLNPRCAYYHGIVSCWRSDKKACKKDITFLFSLLAKDKIKPKVSSRIPLSKVATAQEALESNFQAMDRRGVIVVEPWKCSDDEHVADEK